MFGRAFFVHFVQKFNPEFPENTCRLHYKYGLIMLFEWAGDGVGFAVLIATMLKIQMLPCVVGRLAADVSSLYYRGRLATVCRHPLSSSAMPSPPSTARLFFGGGPFWP